MWPGQENSKIKIKAALPKEIPLPPFASRLLPEFWNYVLFRFLLAFLALCKVHKIDRFNGPSPLQKWCVAGVITSSIKASNFRFNAVSRCNRLRNGRTPPTCWRSTRTLQDIHVALIASIALWDSWAEVSVSSAAEVMEKPKIDAPLMSSTEGVRIFCHRKSVFLSIRTLPSTWRRSWSFRMCNVLSATYLESWKVCRLLSDCHCLCDSDALLTSNLLAEGSHRVFFSPNCGVTRPFQARAISSRLRRHDFQVGESRAAAGLGIRQSCCKHGYMWKKLNPTWWKKGFCSTLLVGMRFHPDLQFFWNNMRCYTATPYYSSQEMSKKYVM